MTRPPVPRGRAEVVTAFGDPRPFVEDKAAWEVQVLVTRPLPFPLPYAYAPTEITRIRAHRLLADLFVEALSRAHARGVPAARMAYGGIYAFRGVRGGSNFSLHTWGIAIDLDPANNPLGVPWDGGERMLHPTIIASFVELGFVWGGQWRRPDAMHFEYAVV